MMAGCRLCAGDPTDYPHIHTVGMDDSSSLFLLLFVFFVLMYESPVTVFAL